MKLTIFAATGGIGRHLLDQAVAGGHDVTAVVRTPAKLTAPVRKIAADLTTVDAEDLATAVEGADAVLSALGPRTNADAGVATRGTSIIVDAMRAADVRRLVVVSAAPIGTVPSPARPNPPRHDPGDGFVMRNLLNPMVKRALRTHYADLAAMEDTLRASDLDWTALRPPRLTDRPGTTHYRTAVDQNVRRGLTIPRADVAHLMLAVLTQPTTITHTIAIAT